MWSLTVTPSSTPAITDTWTREDVKTYLRIGLDDTAEDGTVDAITIAAQEWIESYVSKSLLRRTLVLRLDGWPCSGVIHLPRPPLVSVTSITYTDTAGASQTLASTDYTVSSYRQPGTVQPIYAGTFPSLLPVPDNVVITYEAGYATPELIPQRIRQAGLLLMGTLYEDRESLVTDSTVANLGILESLLANEVCHHEFGEDCG